MSTTTNNEKEILSGTSSNMQAYINQFDGVSPKVIQERIKKRKPNPSCHLSSKKYALQRFGNSRNSSARPQTKSQRIDTLANKNGMRQLIVLDDGTEYIGEWQDNLRHGHGTHCTAEGIYEGEFVDDQYEGQGDYYLWSNETNCELEGRWLLYSGEWRRGKKWGSGTQYDKDGNTYQGEYVKGKKSGQGTMFYANDDTYSGEWFNDMRNGKGEMTKVNGDVFTGIYKDDKRNGPGVLHIKKTQRRLEGVWVDDMFKCGSYYDEQENPVYTKPDDISGTTDGMIPVLELKDPDSILQEALNEK
ncbi:MORN repeat-containing protein 3 [Histomonas meleagridis]|uniref:MORN repeat-containing protein 3 n=1 Tax=Histomonas meleagridis TaxID=135588 RepID=UPI0035595D58|nr:MORN repeat-containing protein 3 [Histomonas meleagridis]KAH0797306.1 MORN repeat-containing protein 3 [Histomonas meleagridis]